ncbi:MAG TPA: hypothetical protein VH025_00800 [Solirubrobacteraceae bacterium]|jgi:hypothetical protein|nr:hypothetical protein [Solirubrobacteraceae bacterium]
MSGQPIRVLTVAALPVAVLALTACGGSAETARRVAWTRAATARCNETEARRRDAELRIIHVAFRERAGEREIDRRVAAASVRSDEALLARMHVLPTPSSLSSAAVTLTVATQRRLEAERALAGVRGRGAELIAIEGARAAEEGISRARAEAGLHCSAPHLPGAS